MAQTQENRYLSVSTPLGADKLLLKSFHGVERISELFRFTLEMESEDPAIDFASIIGRSATISVTLADDSTKYVNGVVGRFVQAGSDPSFTTYYAELYPSLWLLTMSADCQIFQEMSVPDIIESVLGDHGLTSYRTSFEGTHNPRGYCVQYNETAFAFLSRLMEEEGIFYFFEHADGEHTLVIADALSAFADCPGAATVEYGTFGPWSQQNVVPRCTLEERVLVGKVALDDFSMLTPSTDLMVALDSSAAQATRRMYEYPGGFLTSAAGDAIASLRVEEVEALGEMLRGESNCRAFGAGFAFTFEKHDRASANRRWILSKVVHSGTWSGYTNSFEAFPDDLPFRPRRKTPRPRIAGTQTAIVVGPSGEEIWVDEYGRVKVQFHWDQLGQNDEQSSCWIRVAQGWAGQSWGQIFIPRIGQEVVVSFLEGNPDRPLITGSVYNAEQTVPYTLPDDQTKSTIKSNSSKGGEGYNELRFEDLKDSEEVYFQAEKDFNRVVKNDDTLKVGFEKMDPGNQTIDIYNDRTTTIDQGNETLTVKTGNRTIAVDTGNEIHTVAGERSVTVTKKETHTCEDDFEQAVTKNYTLTVQGDLLIDVTGTVTIKSGGDMTIESGGSLSQSAATSLSAEAGTELSNTAGTSLTDEAGTDLTNKAGTTMTNEAGISLTNKGSASQEVDGGGMLTLKGGLVKIN